MKAISWLDKRMPVCADTFVKLLFVLACFSLFNALLAPRSGAPLMHNPLGFAVACLWVLLWNIYFRMLGSTVARVCLGVSSGILFLSLGIVGFGAVHYAYVQHPGVFGLLVAFTPVILIGVPCLCFGSMLWTSIRPPKDAPSVWPKAHESQNHEGFVQS